MRKLTLGKSCLLMLAILCASPFQAIPASALVNNDQPVIPLEIEPVCSDADTSLAHWKVTNKNTAPVNIHWTNIDTNESGDYLAAGGSSKMLTDYEASLPNNTTSFTSGSDTTQTNATKAACQTTVDPTPLPVDCVDGHDQQNLVVQFVAKDTVNITVKDGQFICDDEEVYFSSYIMPANYNGQGFENNPTAYPQTIHSSTNAILPKNHPVNVTMKIALPDSCNNTQIDAYYGPEITTVGPDGHGTQNILSEIYPSTGACSNDTGVSPTNGGNTPAGKGAGEVQNVQSASALSPVTYQLPKTLPNTGSNLALTFALLAALPVAFASFLAAEMFQKRRLVAAEL